jgi:hypothetical protein
MPQTDLVSPGHKLRIGILDAVRRGLLPLVLLVVSRHAVLDLFQVNVLAVHYDYAEDACRRATLILNLSLY